MSEVIVRMEMPKSCYDCPMYDFAVYRGKSMLCCNAHFDLKPIPNNGNPRPSWCPIKGKVEYARMVHERIMDEIKDNVFLKRLEEELFALCKEKEDADC